MSHNNDLPGNNQELTNAANKSHGPQGIDKAPGEETPEDNVQFIQQSQKGKKVDADLTEEAERPIEQDDDL